MREEPKKRLGHLAADLLRIANFIESGSANEAKPIFRESKWFAEWIAPEADLQTQQLLADAQSFLAFQELNWTNWSTQTEAIHDTATAVRNWSQQLLQQAGLVAS